MQLPKHNRHYQTQVDYGRYVAARLRKVSREDLAVGVDQATQSVKDKGRAWQDLNEAVSTDLAHRDAADEALDSLAQVFRLNLASRSVGADKQAPYTTIFPKGLAYYTAAPMSENVARYNELLTRAEAALPSDDPALCTLQASLPGLITNFEQAAKALDAARAQAGVARTALETSVDDWLIQMEKTYGLLVAELTRKVAERFFPRPSSSTGGDPPAPEPTEG